MPTRSGPREMFRMEQARQLIGPRDPDAHKGSFGRVLITAGAGGMPGACFFASRAAMRSGTGLCYTMTAEENRLVLQISCPEVILIREEEMRESLTGLRPPYDAAAFGPGMGTGEEAKRLLKLILGSFRGPLVIDADGLNLLASSEELREMARAYTGGLVLTPHMGEAARLLGKPAAELAKDREGAADELAETYQAAALLKGRGTLISSGRDKLIRINTTGNPGMATAGSGDVLTGVITSLLGQGLSPFDAASLGAFIHGLSGDLASRAIGEYGMIAGDIIRYLPQAFKMITED